MRPFVVVVAVAASLAVMHAAGPAQVRPTGQGFTFRTAVDLINITATVTDPYGRFVPSLRAEDFTVYEDGAPQVVQQFDAERVPVSLGLALDTSGSMIGEKMKAAEAALNRFLYDLLDTQDEVFLYRFDGRPTLVSSWTDDRRQLAAALGNIKPAGGTAIYDTLSLAIPLAQTGTRRKKSILVISDGNDTSSKTYVDEVVRLIRATDVLVYAIGIDASGSTSYGGSSSPRAVPSPFPGKAPPPQVASPAPQPNTPRKSKSSIDRVNPDALRRFTDDTGGRTEIIVSARDLGPATASIADELSRQYFLGYSSAAPRDGRWHTIDVRLNRPGAYTVRARKGFVAN